jgi:hypothetical protein
VTFFFVFIYAAGDFGLDSCRRKIIKPSNFVMEIKDSIFHHKINLFKVCLILIILSGFLFLLSRVLLLKNISCFYLIEDKRLGFYAFFLFFYAIHCVLSHPPDFKKSDSFEG